jgi:hypothetical protein
VEGDAQRRVDRQMALFLECAPGDFAVADRFFGGPARGGGRPRDRAPVAEGSERSRLRTTSGRRWSLCRRSIRGSAASKRAVQPYRVGDLMKVVRPRGELAIPGDIELDAADWLNIMILLIGLNVNRPSEKVDRRAGNKTQNGSAALQTIALPGTRQRDRRSHRRAGNKNPERCLAHPQRNR